MIKKGVTRIVFIFKNYVIKIPNHGYSHNNFLVGCKANWRERQYTKIFKGSDAYNCIAPTVFCSIFGLISIQKRAVIKSSSLTDSELCKIEFLTNERKPTNLGYLNGKFVCVDYG